jgi:phospholipase C
MIVISPWSRGGWVNSELFDHTSLIKFLEARFADRHPDLVEANITPWRRAVTGDLTTAFDFKTPNASRRLVLPSTADARPDLERHPDQVPVPPATGALPRQEHGVKPARALPYTLFAHGVADTSMFRIDFRNRGRAGAVFQVRSANHAEAPRTYTLEPHTHLADMWDASGAGYDLSVFGPNGFFRGFKGRTGGSHPVSVEITESYDANDNEIALEFSNRSGRPVKLTVVNKYTGQQTRVELYPGDTDTKRWSLKHWSGWYDFVVTADDDSLFQQRFAGHSETGEDSISDPVMGGLV